MTLAFPKFYPHRRAKPKARPMNAAERRHADRLVRKGCAVPGCWRQSGIHHEHRHGGLRNHKRLVNLCWKHHQGKGGRGDIGHDAFEERYGINCEQYAKDEWEISLAIEGPGT